MKEAKSELKVIWVCVAVLGAGFLGVDVSALLGPMVAGPVDQTVSAVNDLVMHKQQLTLGGYIAGLGAVYAGGRTVVKAVREWVGGRVVVSGGPDGADHG